MQIQAIETSYKGYKFRSRLEARWAVFFDALDIKWEYEPQGFYLTDGSKYLPDFHLPTFDGGAYVEVKPDGGSFAKARRFAIDSGKQVWLAEGVPDTRVYTIVGICEDCGGEAGHPPRCHEWVGIPNADKAYKENRMFAEPGYERSDGYIDEREFDLLGQHYLEAVRAARGARFEHGEDVYL